MKKTATDPAESATTGLFALPSKAVPNSPGVSWRTDRWRSQRQGWGLAAQFSAAAAALLALTLLVAVALTSWRAGAIAERTIAEDLRRVPDQTRGYVDDQLSRALMQAMALAEEPGAKALAMDDVSSFTRYDWAKSKVEVTRAHTLFMFDKASLVLVRTDKAEGEGVGRPFGAVQWVSDVLEQARPATAVIREGDSLSVVAAAPILLPAGQEMELFGVIALTFALDEKNVSMIQSYTRGEVGLIVDSARRDEPPSPGFSVGTADFGGADFVRRLAELPDFTRTVFRTGEVFGPATVSFAGDLRLVAAVPLFGSRHETMGAVIVSRSIFEETAAFRDIRNTLLMAGALAFLVATPLAFTLGRRLARPLRQLADSAESIRRGALDVDLPTARRGEVGFLASAFQAMVAELREKEELEALVMQHQKSAEVPATAMATLDESRVPATGDVLLPERGDVFAGRYRILARLGQGGSAAVFRATDLELEEDVALKFLRTHDDFGGESIDTTNTEALKHEIRLARRITHPNVIRVHDLGEHGGLRFITMEYAAGTTLHELLAQRGQLGFAPGLQILKQICRGLSAIHATGVLHLDVKPQNIMVLPNGVAKIMDFGISKLQRPLIYEEKLSISGTPTYMSPEHCSHNREDARSDIYSLGVVMYEIFCGAPPFTAADPLALIAKHLRESAPAPTLLRPTMPPRMESLILSCLDKNPSARPQTVETLEYALNRVLPQPAP